MSAIGNWKITLETPMGPQVMQLQITSLGETFRGRIASAMGNYDVQGGVSGQSLNWTMKATKPIPVKVTFEVVIEGDTMRGSAKAGIFGKAALTGERITDVPSVAAAPTPVAVAALQVTADSVDPSYGQPYIAVKEWRADPVRHYYVHGGFTGTDARFSFYFPPADRYQRRFFHNTYPMATSSDIGPFPIQFEVAIGDLGFTLDSGAYYVQTNLGGADRTPTADPAIAAYRVNAAAAKYSRVVARELYGDHRAYGYLFGGSGGSYQVMGAAENTRGVWDGFLPFVIGTPHAIPSMFTIRMHALRILRQRNVFPAIMDAINPGGSGDPYVTLNAEERAALREATLMGYPPRGWWNHESLTSGYFLNVAPLMPMLDPEYLEDFWSRPGYLGSDASSTIGAARFRFDTRVARVIDGYPKQIELEEVPARDFADSHLVVVSGASSGNSIPIATIDGKTLGFAFAADQSAINGIAPGDRVQIDNSWALALQTYHRHQVPEPEFCGWNQFRGPDGRPKYPQREILIGPVGAGNTAGSIPDGHIHGKMLALEALMDIDALPWQADWYRSKVREALGSSFQDSFALWFIDHAQHENPLTPAARAHTVSFAGALQQGLRDLSAWVEKGARPPDTNYRVVDSQVEVPARAAQRGGIQPVVHLQVNGGTRAEVAAGQAVTFTAAIEVPPRAGSVVAAEWDFEGAGTFPVVQQVDPPAATVSLSRTHVFSKPGTYFPVLRATSQRSGDAQTRYARVQNLGRARVVVR
jgi:hypothetical protein